MKKAKRQARRTRLFTFRMYEADFEAIERLSRHLKISRARALETIINDWKAYRIGRAA